MIGTVDENKDKEALPGLEYCFSMRLVLVHFEVGLGVVFGYVAQVDNYCDVSYSGFRKIICNLRLGVWFFGCLIANTNCGAPYPN